MSDTSSDTPGIFPNTRWSVVLAAAQTESPDSAAALETICREYWYPLYAYARRSGQSPQDAQDLTQEFFCRLLEKHWLDSVHPSKGKLRTFLVVALKNFMKNEWRRALAQKRGGDWSRLQFDTAFAESRLAADTCGFDPDQLFDRQWALTLLDLTMTRLRADFAAAGKLKDFDALKECLVMDHEGFDYAKLAGRLGVNEGAARVAVHRLRKRFREVYRREISQTLADGADLGEELRHLASVLAKA